MAIEEITISSLKQTKNAIIGNPTAKRTLAQDEAFVGTLVTFLYKSDERVITTSENEDELRVEAAHILASLSYGSAETLRPLLKTDALPAMVLALSNYGPPSTPAVKIALARVLKTLGAALVDVVGPPQWGLHANYPEIQEDAKTTLDKLVTIDAFDICLPLLASPSSQLSMAIAQLLASTLRLQTHRVVASEWVPLSERNKEIKGKRGWEKTEASSSPSKDGGWLARQLVVLIQKKDAKLQEAALSALASLTRDNPSVATGLTRSTPDHNSILNMVLSSCKSRNTNLQLAACLCASNIFRASFTPHSLVMDQSAPMTVIHVMNGLLEAENESPQTRMKACYILYYLVADEKDLCQLAYERGSLTKLAQLVKSITPSDISTLPNWDEDEPDSLSALRAAALTAIASISLFDTDIRGEVSGNLKLIPYIQVCLFHRHVGVRYAACQCVRALSRAVAVLRTNLVDSGLGLSVYQVFCREDEDARVTHAAASVICNIISDFSPLQSTLLEQGVIERLVRLLQSGESTLMLDALWAFKNILYKSNLDVKRRVMHALCWSTVASLLNHENTGFQEQTFHILRNLADTQEGVDMIFDELSSEFLLRSLSRALESDNDDVLRQAVYLTGNLSNSAAHSREILSHAKILQSLRVCLSDAKVDVRRPAVVCICELIRANPRSYKEFRDSGIESTLRHICDYGGGFMSSSPTSTRFHHHHSHHIGVEDDREVKSKAKEALDLLQCAFPEME